MYGWKLLDWLILAIYMVSGFAAGSAFKGMYSLTSFIQALDQEGDPCKDCSFCGTCRALQKIGNSNLVTELTYTSYLIVRKTCRYVVNDNKNYMWLFGVLNGVLYAGVYIVYGMSVLSVLYCICTTVLIYITVVDWKTQYIPLEFNLFIGILGIIKMVFEPQGWMGQLIGLGSISILLLIIDLLGGYITHGSHVIGGGDIKLMAAAGLLIGWKLNIVAFFTGCILGTVIHLVIMKIGKGERRLAFGPYLSMGIYIAMICGEQLMSWYLGIMGL